MFESWVKLGGVQGDLAVGFELADDIHDAFLRLLDFAKTGLPEVGNFVVDRFGRTLRQRPQKGLP